MKSPSTRKPGRSRLRGVKLLCKERTAHAVFNLLLRAGGERLYKRNKRYGMRRYKRKLERLSGGVVRAAFVGKHISRFEFVAVHLPVSAVRLRLITLH